MKNILIMLFLVCIAMACRKSRTCSCTSTNVSQSTTTPRNGGAATTTQNTGTSSDEFTVSKVKKTDLTRLYDCNSRTETSTNTYTTTVFTGTTFGVADVSQTNTTTYDCEIK
jgi:hypothetical protein